MDMFDPSNVFVLQYILRVGALVLSSWFFMKTKTMA